MSSHSCRYRRSASVLGVTSLTIAALICSSGQAETVAPNEVTAVKWLPRPVPVKDAEAECEAEMKAYTEVVQGTALRFDMAAIPGGKFLLGSPKGEKDRKNDEGPQVEVTIEPFWMATHEVTCQEYRTWSYKLDQWQRKKQNLPATDWDKLADALARPTDLDFEYVTKRSTNEHPAVCMSQYAAQMYCRWLCGKTGRYYRLPTEAEWEYACRAGTQTAYSFGDDPSKLGDYAWFFNNSDAWSHKVGTKKPNPWGLYDMHGNVAEWVLDQYRPDTYKKWSEATGLKSPYVVATTKYPCTVRGGSWDDDAEALRCASRRGSNRDWNSQDPQIPQSIWTLTDASFVGFRVVRPLRKPTEEEAKRYEPDPQILKEYRRAVKGPE